METENKGLIDVRDCPCDGCKAKPCGHPARCVKFTLWLNKTVDAVEVVRCCNCSYWNPRYETMGMCMKHNSIVTFTKPDFYCAWAEEKNDGICKKD